MSLSKPVPPFSPVLLVGLALAPLPESVWRPFLSVTARVLARNHAAAFDRLEGLWGRTFLFDPVDLPLRIALRLEAPVPRLTVADDDDAAAAVAVVRGPLIALIDLLEGRLDGDALFFSRELMVEGEAAAVVALRNAVDSEEIDLVEDLLSTLGPFGWLARRLLGAARAAWGYAASDLETLQAALIAPALRRCDDQAAGLGRIEQRLDAAAVGPRKRGGRAGRSSAADEASA